MLEHKRELDELIAIYLLEEDFLDIYVEGPTDKFVFENYLKYKKKDKSVVEIDDLNLSTIIGKYSDLDLSSNKDKLIALSRILDENKIGANVKCLIDRDFDGIINDLEINNYLLYTEYCCLESYFFCREHIDKLLKFGIKNFPVQTEFVIEQIAAVLGGIFKIRMINKHFNFNLTLPRIESNTPVDKKTGICSFDFVSYLNKFIKSNNLQSRMEEIELFLERIEDSIPNDNRCQMNGHDLIMVLFNYINKIKNTVNFRLENFERAFYLAVQPNDLDKYELFRTVSA